MTDLTEPRYTDGDEHEHVLTSGEIVSHSHGGPASDLPYFTHPVAFSIAHQNIPIVTVALSERQAQSLYAKVVAWLRR